MVFCWECFSPDWKGCVSFCHHFASIDHPSVFALTFICLSFLPETKSLKFVIFVPGKKKPFTDKDGKNESEDRHVVAQPIQFGDTYNARKLNNLPYHLTMSGKINELREECLLNIEFLLSKLKAISYRYDNIILL